VGANSQYGSLSPYDGLKDAANEAFISAIVWERTRLYTSRSVVFTVFTFLAR
jgi:hypothetical protein